MSCFPGNEVAGGDGEPAQTAESQTADGAGGAVTQPAPIGEELKAISTSDTEQAQMAALAAMRAVAAGLQRADSPMSERSSGGDDEDEEEDEEEGEEQYKDMMGSEEEEQM